MTFSEFRNRLAANFAAATKGRVLFDTDIDRDALWDLYLDSFPKGTNEVFRVRREFDCSCCRHFMKNIGGTLYIDDDMNVHSIFEFDAGSEVYQPVVDALAKYNAGPYAYWLAAGFPADADEAMIENVITLFCAEHLAEAAEEGPAA